MAPFKLKFLMGNSRSTSQEHDSDPQVNEALLNHRSTALAASSSTIDSADCNSVGSLGSSEHKSLLPNKVNNLRLGYLNQTVAPCAVDETTPRTSTTTTTATVAATATATATAGLSTVPTTPPPSYEHVLQENSRLSSRQHRQLSGEGTPHQSRPSVHFTSLEQLVLSDNTCTDPDCRENYANNGRRRLQRQPEVGREQNPADYDYNENTKDTEGEEQETEAEEVDFRQVRAIYNNNEYTDEGGGESEGVDRGEYEYTDDHNNDAVINVHDQEDSRKESFNSNELLIAANMTAPSSQQSLLDNCTGDCQQYGGVGSASGCTNDNNDFYDPLLNHHNYCGREGYCDEDFEELSQNQALPPGCAASGVHGDNDGVGHDGWDTKHSSSRHDYQHHHHHHHSHQQCQCQSQQQQQQQQHYQYQQEQCPECPQQQPSQTPEIISNKSSKEIYKDLAKQWGITCKMSDGCRCMECQSHYFDCEFDDNEHQKSDGGLGAGTPMFISEVMHGTACTIL